MQRILRTAFNFDRVLAWRKIQRYFPFADEVIVPVRQLLSALWLARGVLHVNAARNRLVAPFLRDHELDAGGFGFLLREARGAKHTGEQHSAGPYDASHGILPHGFASAEQSLSVSGRGQQPSRRHTICTPSS